MQSDKPIPSKNALLIRPVEERDNQELARIIREVLTEFGANRPGFAWQDPELDFMSRAYEAQQRVYLVAERDGKLLGGGGIGEFESGDETRICELQKMYLLPEGRALGVGRQLMDKLLIQAKRLRYQQCYLETLSSMTGARKLYLRTGFRQLPTPLGDSGHNACDEWYLLDLKTWESEYVVSKEL